jgi:hypothetical protein
VCICIVFLLAAPPIAQGHLDKAAIQAALDAGQNGALRDVTCEAKDPDISPALLAQHRQRPGNGPLAVVFRGPLARIAAAAEEAKQNGQLFTPEDISEDTARDQVTLTLTPETPTDRFAPSPWAIIIRNGSHKDKVVQALRFEAPALASAVFDPRAVHYGEFELAVVTHDPSDGERTCTISAGEALRIR